MKRLVELGQQLGSKGEVQELSSFQIRPLSAADREQVRTLFLANGVPFNDKFFDEVITDMYGKSQPTVYYLVAVSDASKKLYSIGSLFYEDKFTRGGCVAAHIGDIYSIKTTDGAAEQRLHYALTEALQKISFQLRPQIYKVSAHVRSEDVQLYAEKLKFSTDDKEIHMIVKTPIYTAK